jgi:energy-coupling factor transporter ATP-binding protein EcfA2
MITTTDSDEQRTVPFDVWSGGEGQRLRLAGTLGLIDFIENYNNVAFDIEVYDEPTTWLSNVGISNLLEALAERAEVLNRRILVVDHRDLASMGEFTNTVNVIKDDNGTHIE